MRNDIVLGDCLDVLETMENESVDAVITDPPYQYLKHHKLDKPFDEQKYFQECFRVLREGYLVFFGRGSAFYRWNVLCEQTGFEFVEEVIWDKIRATSPMLTLQRVHETIAVYRKGKKKLNKVYIDKIEYDKQCNPQTIESDLKR